MLPGGAQLHFDRHRIVSACGVSVATHLAVPMSLQSVNDFVPGESGAHHRLAQPLATRKGDGGNTCQDLKPIAASKGGFGERFASDDRERQAVPRIAMAKKEPLAEPSEMRHPRVRNSYRPAPCKLDPRIGERGKDSQHSRTNETRNILRHAEVAFATREQEPAVRTFAIIVENVARICDCRL